MLSYFIRNNKDDGDYMTDIIILLCTIIVFGIIYYGIRNLNHFIKSNRRGRKNYEYFFTDDEED